MQLGLFQSGIYIRMQREWRHNCFGNILRDLEPILYLPYMFTFLRKIRRSLLDSGATRKYLLYAIGEILLVMVGILLALQVNNWNQDRIGRNKENLLLREINSEFLINKEELTNILRLYKSAYQKLDIITESFPLKENSYDIDSLASLLQGSSTIRDADLSEGSISSLINSSEIEIISNSELRSLLIQWKDLVSDYQRAEGAAINFTMEQYFPYMDEKIPQPYHEGLKDNRIDLSFLNSIKFENMIKRRRSYIVTMFRIAEGDDGAIINTIDRIIELSTLFDQ